MRLFILLTGLWFAGADLGVAQSITYDYTGTVTAADGIFASVPVGATVTGTYTFDFANAIPSQSSGVVGSSTQFWNAGTYSPGGPSGPPVPVVFSSTAEVDGVNFVTNANVSYESGISGGPQLYGPIFIAREMGTLSSSVYQGSQLALQGDSQVPWSSTGLPLLNRANVLALGNFAEFNGPQESAVGFNITSLTPATHVPEIDAKGVASAFTLLLGGFAVFRDRSLRRSLSRVKEKGLRLPEHPFGNR